MDRDSLQEAEGTNCAQRHRAPPAAEAAETRCSICPQLRHLSLAVSSQIGASISLSIGRSKWKHGAADAQGSPSSSPTCHQL